MTTFGIEILKDYKPSNDYVLIVLHFYVCTIAHVFGCVRPQLYESLFFFVMLKIAFELLLFAVVSNAAMYCSVETILNHFCVKNNLMITKKNNLITK